MNVDIHMAPKDYNRIMGLCGRFDGNAGNDFHDRNGNEVSRPQFIDAWEVGESDIKMLEPTCSVNVETWQGDGQLLYCTCNCNGDNKIECGKPEETVTCSPSQYVNCSVSHSKNSELCQDYTERCNVERIAKRSSFNTDPEAEMERRAALAKQPHIFVVKRQVDEPTNISEEMAYAICTSRIMADTNKRNLNLLGGFNVTQAIIECAWDVHTGQDSGWADTHKQAADAAIGISFKRDANYTLSHMDELREFNAQSCPYNCSGNGICLENGTCSCQNSYFGPICGSDKLQGPVIEDLEGGGFCDQRYGSECRCFSVQTDALAETFTCKLVRKKKLLNGEIQNVGSASTNGKYRNLYNGQCCFADGRNIRSSDTEAADVLHYLYDISLSNDGLNFGPASTVYVFDSSCLNARTDDTGLVTFNFKDNTCLIHGNCYAENDVDLSNECNKCLPSKTQSNWTEACVSTDATDGLSTGQIAGIVVGTLVVVVFVIILCLVCFKKANKNRLSIQASQEFTVFREESKSSFNVANLQYRSTEWQ